MKNQAEVNLTAAEWSLMECLWEKAPRTGREAAEHLEKRVGWSRSTTLTMLRRMTEKGLVACGETDGVKTYAPNVLREDAVRSETEHFLERVYKGSVSLLVSAVTRRQDLSREEIDELYAILKQAEEAKEHD